jgi:hypothetical protein
MMYREENGRVLAISQPAHAWISGQLMARVTPAPDEPLRLAAELHDLGWLDWEREPEFDADAGRPPTFREVAGARHTAMWTLGVERALAAWGPHLALMVSRHGGRIYRKFGLYAGGPEEKAAIHAYLDAQAPREAAWAAALGLDAAELDRRSAWVAFSDALSLAVCGNLAPPIPLELPGAELKLTQAAPYDLRLDPWPFAGGAFVIEGEGRPMPESGRFADEAQMRAWLASPKRETFRTRLAPL